MKRPENMSWEIDYAIRSNMRNIFMGRFYDPVAYQLQNHINTQIYCVLYFRFNPKLYMEVKMQIREDLNE